MRQICVVIGLIGAMACGSVARESAGEYLASGRIQEGVAAYADEVQKSGTGEARFTLAVLQVCAALESLGQGLYDLGFRLSLGEVEVPQPVPLNTSPPKVTPIDVERLAIEFERRLEEVSRTLDATRGQDFRVKIDFTRIHLDLNHDGQSTESLAQMCGLFDRGTAEALAARDSLVVTCDAADARWLHGYVELLRAMVNAGLGYDLSPWFPVLGQHFFARPDTAFCDAQPVSKSFELVDAIAAVHLISFEPSRPDRIRAVREHLLAAMRESRAMLELAGAESDNDAEWIPGPHQTSVVGLPLTAAMRQSWLAGLEEFEQVLEGRKLVPHPRFPGRRGVNVRKMFEAPPRFDVVLFVHGTAVLPYLEVGELTEPEFWGMLPQAFGGEFLRTALWIN
jgi:hypothetical protein